MDLARLIVLYGAWIACGLIVVGAAAMLVPGRGNKWCLPGSILGWFGALIGFSIFGIGAFSLAVFVLVDVGGKGDALLAMESARGQAAPELRYRGIDGEPATLRDLEGQVVLLNFWATWCPPCIDEMPSLDAVQRAYADRGLVVLHLSDEAPSRVSEWLQEHPMASHHGTVDPGAQTAPPFDALNQARPVSFLIDRDGIIRDSAFGLMSQDRIERMVKPYL